MPADSGGENSRRAVELLAAICGDFVSGQDRGAAGKLAGWPDLLSLADLAGRHNILPLLAHSLPATSLGSAAATAVQARAWQIALHNLRLSAELLDIMSALETAGILALAYKGPALAQQLYPDLSMRQFSDLDVLVSPADASRAISILHMHGLSDVAHLASSLLPHLIRTQCEWQLSIARSATVVELHWAPFPRYFSIEFPFPQLQRAATRVALAGRSVPVPGPDDLFLLLCAHGAKHFWYRLGWLVDLALLMRDPALDPARLLVRAEQKGLRRILLFSAALATQVLRLELPPAFDAALRRDPGLPPLIAAVSRSLYDGSPPADRLTENLILLRARERWSDRIRIVLRLAFTPGPEEWRAVTLPKSLQWVYPLIRLVRAMRYLPRVARRTLQR